MSSPDCVPDIQSGSEHLTFRCSFCRVRCFWLPILQQRNHFYTDPLFAKFCDERIKCYRKTGEIVLLLVCGRVETYQNNLGSA